MENSETQQEIVNLGKLLVQQLKLDNSVDTLGRWMAHHIAELIKRAEVAEGSDKLLTEDACCRSILALWKHRWETVDHKPLKDFERIFELIQRMDPERQDPYYYHRNRDNRPPKEDVWLNAAYGIDQVARVCLKYALSQAAEDAGTEYTTALLRTARAIDSDADITIIEQLFARKKYQFDPDNIAKSDPEFEEDFRIKSIQHQLDAISNFSKYAEFVKQGLINDLKAAKGESNRDDDQIDPLSNSHI